MSAKKKRWNTPLGGAARGSRMRAECDALGDEIVKLTGERDALAKEKQFLEHQGRLSELENKTLVSRVVVAEEERDRYRSQIVYVFRLATTGAARVKRENEAAGLRADQAAVVFEIIADELEPKPVPAWWSVIAGGAALFGAVFGAAYAAGKGK